MFLVISTFIRSSHKISRILLISDICNQISKIADISNIFNKTKNIQFIKNIRYSKYIYTC